MEAATFVTTVRLQLAGDTFEFSTATTLFIFMIKTMLLDSLFHYPKTHHLFVAEQLNEKKKTFQPVFSRARSILSVN